MRHYLLTRSIYDPADWPLAANQRRLALTAAVTTPSIAAQTERRFRWIVAVHPEDELLDARKALFRQAGFKAKFVAYRGHGVRARTAAYAYREADWRRHMAEPDQPTLTTRIDDDDAFSPNALGRVREAAEALHTRTALILPEGFRVNEGRYSAVRHERNAWVSLLAPEHDGALIHDFSHKRIADHVPVQLLDDRPGWLWVRHGDTLSGHREAAKPIDDALRETFPGIDWAALES